LSDIMRGRRTLAQFDGQQWLGMGDMISLEDLRIIAD